MNARQMVITQGILVEKSRASAPGDKGKMMRFGVGSCVAFAAVLFGVGCSGSGGQSSAVVSVAKPGAAVSAPAVNAQVVGHFKATFDPVARTMGFTHVEETGSDGTVSPQNLIPVTIQQGGGVVGSGQSINTVDLLSPTNCPVINGTTYSCDVELRSFFTQTLTYAYVQIDSETYVADGGPTSAFDSINSDQPLSTTNNGNVAIDHGLWAYTNASENAGAISPVLLPYTAGNGYNTATRTWILNYPNTTDTVSYDILVWAVTGFEQYTVGGSNVDGTYGNEGYMDACTGGTSVRPASTVSVTLPFDFNLYEVNSSTASSTVKICTVGGIAVGTTATCPSPFTVPTEAGQPKPSLFAFWDQLKFGTAANDKAPADGTPAQGQICYQTIGSAPNRMEVIEWRNMDFFNTPDQGSSLNFEVYLYEGTGEVDIVYNSMNDAAGDATSRAEGVQALVGTQGFNDKSVLAPQIVAFQQAEFSSGLGFTLIPSP